eukprot:Ihof_evm8s2 gene=Ihof_evmTU8s2
MAETDNDKEKIDDSIKTYTWQASELGAPRLVKELCNLKVARIGVGSKHIVIITDQGLVYTYGDGKYGQLGLGDTYDRIQPCLVEKLKNQRVIYLTCGKQSTAVITNNGQLFFWGRAIPEQMDRKNNNIISTPKLISLPWTKIAKVAMGTSHIVAITNEGECWVSGTGCQLGLGHGIDRTSTLTRVETLVGYPIESVACGASHTVAIVAMVADTSDHMGQTRQTRAVFTWGKGERGQLGHHDLLPKWIPTRLTALDGKEVIMVAAGKNHSIALTIHSIVYVWGSNECKQLDDSPEKVMDSPELVKSMTGVKVFSVAAGDISSWYLYSSNDSSAGQLCRYGCDSSIQFILEDVDVRCLTVKGDAVACLASEHGSMGTTNLQLQQFMDSERTFFARLMIIEKCVLIPLCLLEEDFQGKALLKRLLRCMNFLISQTSKMMLSLSGRMLWIYNGAELVYSIVEELDIKEYAKAYEHFSECISDIIAMNLFDTWEEFDSSVADAAVEFVEDAELAFPHKYETIWTPFQEDENSARQSRSSLGQSKSSPFTIKKTTSKTLQTATINLTASLSRRPVEKDKTKRSSMLSLKQFLNHKRDDDPLDILQIPLLRLKNYADIFLGLHQSLHNSNTDLREASVTKLSVLCHRLGHLADACVATVQEARRTSAFWKSFPKIAKTLMEPKRRLITHSKEKHPLYAANQSIVWMPLITQWFILFNDALVHSIWNSVPYNLDTVWIEDIPDSELHTNSFRLIMPETMLVLSTLSQEAKMEWIALIAGAVNLRIKKKSRKSIVEDLESPEIGILPPLIRNDTTYTFSSTHPLFKDAVYTGDWNRAKMEGNGKMVFSNGNTYVGRWIDSAMNTFGCLSTCTDDTHEVYIGEMFNNEVRGFGTKTYSTGDVYRGHWLKAKHHGFGSLHCQNGIMYIGAWSEGLRKGYGVMANPITNEKYLGIWSDNLRNGQGISVTPTTCSQGNFFGNKMSGTGLMIMDDGKALKKYEGEWACGHPRGAGVISLANGDSITGTFQSDIYDGSFQTITKAEPVKKSGPVTPCPSMQTLNSYAPFVPEETSASAVWDPLLEMTSSTYCFYDPQEAILASNSIFSEQHGSNSTCMKYVLVSEKDAIIKISAPLHSEQYIPERLRWEFLIDEFKVAARRLLIGQGSMDKLGRNNRSSMLAIDSRVSSTSDISIETFLRDGSMAKSMHDKDLERETRRERRVVEPSRRMVARRNTEPSIYTTDPLLVPTKTDVLDLSLSDCEEVEEIVEVVRRASCVAIGLKASLDETSHSTSADIIDSDCVNSHGKQAPLIDSIDELAQEYVAMETGTRRSPSGFIVASEDLILPSSMNEVPDLTMLWDEMEIGPDQLQMDAHMRLGGSFKLLADLHNEGTLYSDNKCDELCTLLQEVFNTLNYPLAQLCGSLSMAYRTSYEGSGSHRHLLPKAVYELHWVRDTVYDAVVALFPEIEHLQLLPKTQAKAGDTLTLDTVLKPAPSIVDNTRVRSNLSSLAQAFIDDSNTHSKSSFTQNEELVDSRAEIFEPVIFPFFYKPLFDLYVLNIDESEYWKNISLLGERGDVELLAYLGLRQNLWLLPTNKVADIIYPVPTCQPVSYHASSMVHIKAAESLYSNFYSSKPIPRGSLASRGSAQGIWLVENIEVDKAMGNTPIAYPRPSRNSTNPVKPFMKGSSLHSASNLSGVELNNALDVETVPAYCNVLNNGEQETLGLNKTCMKTVEENRKEVKPTKYLYGKAIEAFKTLSDMQAPLRKVRVLHMAFKELQDEITAHGLHIDLWAMNDLLPLYLYLIIRARIPHL